MFSITGSLRAYSNRMLIQSTRNITSFTNGSPLTNLRQQINSVPQSFVAAPSDIAVSPFRSILGLMQRRFKSRGNTFQPNMLKRKRVSGFLTRLKNRNSKKIIARRRAKGRWFLSY